MDPARLERGLDALAGLGFEPVRAANLASRHGLFAGTDDERLAAFHELAADPTIRAILFARGGWGLLRVLPRIDWDLLSRVPRAYVGYSDLTPFLLEVVRRLGLVAFHGPMVAADLWRGLLPEEEASFLGALAGDYPAEHPLAGALRPGEAAGPLLGGCLSLLVTTLGTPYAPDLEGALVVWEDVAEPPYRIDRMLTHLRLSGSLNRISGMIVGHLDAAGGRDGGPDGDAWGALIAESLSGFDWPLARGARSGHDAPNWTLPLGLSARLEVLDAPDEAAGRLVLGQERERR